MRLELACVVLGAILLARGDARPQQIETNETRVPEVKKENEEVRSRVEMSSGERELNHYQHIDQSLRTMTTQLLNVTGSNDMAGLKSGQETDKKLILLSQQSDKNKIQNNSNNVKIINSNNEKKDVEIVKKNEPEIITIDGAEGAGYSRPVNSKYQYLHVSHPGQAMALTDEELEIELSATKSPVFHRNSPSASSPAATTSSTTTTVSGISTWVQVNPPKTTPKPSAKTTEASDDNNIPTSVDTITQINSKPSTKADKPDNTKTPPTVSRVTTAHTTLKATVHHKPSITRLEKPAVESLSTSATSQFAPETSTTPKSSSTTTTDDNLEFDATANKKTLSSSRNSSKTRSTTPKSTTTPSKVTTTKVVKTTPSNRPSKPSLIRKPSSNKNDVTKIPSTTSPSFNATSRIEKVTFKPIQTIDTPSNVFVKKIQASFQTNSNNSSQSLSSDSDLAETRESSILTNDVNKLKPLKPNNSQKSHPKKPIDTPTTIEIEPIKVNAPILRIEKIEDPKRPGNSNNKKDELNLDNSQIDVKFDFNPESSKVETSTAVVTTTAVPTASTKKPKGSLKRKKHKTRRRKPSPSSTTTTTSASSPQNDEDDDDDDGIDIDMSAVTDIFEKLAQNVLPLATDDSTDSLNSLQESKVVPDTKTTTAVTDTAESANVNNKNKKKQAVKPIGTQIYNYLSREVMPSFGVMSLVGLGLGLASYFLYPFGTVIARRNDEVNSNYNYSPSEYGGNYGQKEEDVFSKVLQGMSPGDEKYGGITDYEKNHYRYQVYGEPVYTTKKEEVKYQTPSPINTPLPYEIKYRNTEFKYPDLTTTSSSSSYYDYNQKQKPSFDYSQNHRNQNYEGQVVGNVDRQFVVGNVPKEYSRVSDGEDTDSKNMKIITTTESMVTDFEKQIAQSMKFLKNPLENSQIIEAQPLKADGFDEVEITPAAVAVEHGPRSLRLEDLVGGEKIEGGLKKRIRRESVIQLIPTRSEIEKEQHEEDLSNEIFNIVDSALPPDMDQHTFKMKEVKKSEPAATDKPREELTTSTQQVTLKTKEFDVGEATTPKITTTTTTPGPVTDSRSTESTSTSTSTGVETETDWDVVILDEDDDHIQHTSSKPIEENFSPFDIVKRIAEVKVRLGLTILKRASENFAKYLGQVQKRLNGGD